MWCVPLAMVAWLTGCGSAEREFAGYTRDQVWMAMVETAKDPRYPDWLVVDNEVWRDDLTGTVQIRRDVRRDLVIVGQRPRREEFEWKFTAVVQSTDPPILSFSTTTPCVPAHFWLQGQQFMNEVERRLAGMSLPPARAVPSVTHPAEPSKDGVPAEKMAAATPEFPVETVGQEQGIPPEIPAVSGAAVSVGTTKSRDMMKPN